MLVERFGEVCDDPMVDLINLRQKGLVADYHEQFDAIITGLELSEEYILSCFLGGLKQDVQIMVRMFQPQSVRKVFSLAKLYESSHNSNSFLPFHAKNSKPPILAKPSLPNKTFLATEPPKELLNQKSKHARKHNLSHKKLQLHVMEVEDGGDEVLEPEEVKHETHNYGEPQIYVNALTGMTSFRIMRITWHYNKKSLHILIDSGSTDNFLDIQKAKTLGCKIEKLEPLMVTVADEWLVTLGDVTWNFDKLTMDFIMHGRRHVLRGYSNNGVKTIKKQQLEKPPILAQLGQVLERFAEVFQEPTQLPPMRDGHNHQNPLLQGTNPVNKRPYRYTKHQKDIIDELVQDMLHSGIIQNSSSPYASPVVLVGKKDDSWRLCVDYRELNKGNVKDRFPIPLVEDLMDELHGSTIFSKLDLRAGYHQVGMDPSDIHKTAFRTHGGHFEYLVMPFGLTNAPATFQAHVLALPDFSKFFLVEVDASGVGLGALLMQDHHLIAYISRSLSIQQQSLSTYEKELMAVVFARLTTTFQQKLLVKLMGFDFTIEYKQGQENIAADALSRIDTFHSLLVHEVDFALVERIKQSWHNDDG
ncbi:PREDICTED: uncharacterized protein LOC109359770 [Lupinus angustifolius]|uniref:uncharacterized protein LOC109359770 n=1 Tax=Lupinus angustifolius TaxID=3871 RepID=UPI00092F3CD7|nr:PREDICTED: uncharacterized protein LOC109359770 [Lupinus angustifolius]